MRSPVFELDSERCSGNQILDQVGPLDDRNASGEHVLLEPDCADFLTVAQPISIVVMNRQSTDVLLLDHESRAADAVVFLHTQPSRKPLGELRLPAAELADQSHNGTREEQGAEHPTHFEGFVR